MQEGVLATDGKLVEDDDGDVAPLVSTDSTLEKHKKKKKKERKTSGEAPEEN